MIKLTYSENHGAETRMEFEGGADLIEFISKLLSRKLFEGATIFIHSFTGPMVLGKMVYNYLSEDK